MVVAITLYLAITGMGGDVRLGMPIAVPSRPVRPKHQRVVQ